MKKIIKNTYVPYIALFVVMFLWHLPMTLNISDDANFGTLLAEMNIWSLIKRIYFTGSGKIFSDTAGAVFAYLPSIIWKIIDSIVRVLIAWCMVYVFTDRKALARWIAVIVALLFPKDLLLSAGYCVTSTNYVWPSLAILVALIPMRDSIDGKKSSWTKEIVFMLACLYGANQEQAAAILIAAHIVFMIYGYTKRIKISPFIYVNFIASILMLIVFITSPGFRSKSVLQYNTVALPYFPVMGVVDKLSLGFSTSVAHFISQINVVFLVFLFVLSVLVIKRQENILLKCVGTLPLMVCVSLRFFSKRLDKFFANITNWSFKMVDFLPVNTSNFDDYKSYVPMAVGIGIICLILICFYLAYGNKIKSLLMMVIFLAGLSSRIVMGFSYTVFGSGNRTFIYAYFALMLLILLMANDVLELWNAKESVVVNKKIVTTACGFTILIILLIALLQYLSATSIRRIVLPDNVAYQNESDEGDLTYEININENDRYVSANGWCIKKGEDNTFFDIQLLLINDKNDVYALKTDYVQLYNLTLVMNDGNDYENGGFRTRMKKKNLDKLAGNVRDYRLCIWYRCNGNNVICKTEGIAR